MSMTRRQTDALVDEHFRFEAMDDGEEHMSHVRQLPGLTRFVQNYVVASPAGHVCDGVGELWFESAEVMEAALNSPEMGAAVESAKNLSTWRRRVWS